MFRVVVNQDKTPPSVACSFSSGPGVRTPVDGVPSVSLLTITEALRFQPASLWDL